jgi:hypothetical protein
MSAKTVNLIPNRNSLYSDTSNDWAGLNATTLRSGIKIFSPTKDKNDQVDLAYYALQISPVTHGNDFGTYLPSLSISAENSQKWIQVQFMVYSEQTFTADLRLDFDEVNAIDVVPPIERLRDVLARTWTVIRTEPIQVPETSVDITASVIFNTFGPINTHVYIAIPSVIVINKLYDNRFVHLVVQQMPDFYMDQVEVNVGLSSVGGAVAATKRFLDVGLNEANAGLELYLSYFKFDKENGFDPTNPIMPLTHRSALVDAQSADENTRKWLVQFSGRSLTTIGDYCGSIFGFPQTVPLIDANITYTGVQTTSASLSRTDGLVSTNVFALAPEFYEGTGVVMVRSNTNNFSSFNGIYILSKEGDTSKLWWYQDVPDDVSADVYTIKELDFESVKKYSFDRASFEKYQISTGNYGLNSGTLKAIEDTVKTLLTGTKTIVADYDTKWQINIQTKVSETPTFYLTDNPYSVLEEVIKPILPVGYSVAFSLLAFDNGETITLDAEPAGRLNLYSLGYP